MATNPPKDVVMTLPPWMWNGALDDFMQAARLTVIAGSDLTPEERRVETLERGARGRPGLVQVHHLAGSPLESDDYTQLAEADSSATLNVNERLLEQTAKTVQRAERSAARRTGAGLLAPGLALHQLQTTLALPGWAAATVEAVVDDLRECRFSDDNEQIYGTVGAFLVRRHPALMHRSKIPQILMRMAVDGKLREADLDEIKAANEDGQIVFSASEGLGDGFSLLDPYLTPLLGALTPYVWAFSASRPAGTIVYTLETPVLGAVGEALEPLHLLPSRGPIGATPEPEVEPHAAAAAVIWWVRRLDRILSVISDPALFRNGQDRYVPTHHQHAILTLDQLFRRVGSIQQSHRDGDARRVLLFTVLDTLERLTDRRLTQMCTLSFASRTLDCIRADMPGEVQQILLPAAARAVEALERVQEGFYVSRQTGASSIDFNLADGTTQSYTPEEAAAEYIRVLRNATHGHGSDRAEAVPRTDALLTHHSGVIDHDLPLLGYLYLLELLTKPDMLRRVLFSSTRV